MPPHYICNIDLHRELPADLDINLLNGLINQGKIKLNIYETNLNSSILYLTSNNDNFIPYPISSLLNENFIIRYDSNVLFKTLWSSGTYFLHSYTFYRNNNSLWIKLFFLPKVSSSTFQNSNQLITPSTREKGTMRLSELR